MARHNDERNCRHVVEMLETFWNHYNLSSEGLIDEELRVFIRDQGSSSDPIARDRHCEGKSFFTLYNQVC